MLTKVHFTLPANYVAGATEGFLLGEFNKWNPEEAVALQKNEDGSMICLLYTSPSTRDRTRSRMPSSA